MAVVRVAEAYREIDMGARVAAADRHGLIQLLFDELAFALAQAEMACRQSDRTARSRASARAMSILSGLSSSLDSERGGEVAALLGAVYAKASADIITASRTESPRHYSEIASRINDIASAWRLIGTRR